MHKVSDLRNSFIDFFKSKGHKQVHSSPLIPQDDPTLLFTTAGMVQFKPMFAGTVIKDYKTATTVQKCLRTSDLENVGRTERHCTFFEMLGNFSFGDYFKEEAIQYAWEYSVDVLKFDKEKIWVSIYLDDDEAFEIWNKKIGVPAERIVRLGKEDNFWGPAGDSGACGPCSELYIDKGEEHGCGSPDCKPGCDCERYMEYWNLVFNQFDQDKDGNLKPLPQTGIDTGMGLERLATICQGVTSIFETDELRMLVDFVCNSLGIKYEGENIVPVNVIVEHARSLTFAMTDGAYPSNEGRGYVLRRILRRALRFGRYIGIKEPFVYKLVDPIVEIMGEHYPEIISSAENVKNVLLGEEKRFLETLDTGINKLEEFISNIEKSGLKSLSGKDAFILYDTYGFPAEMTNEICEERGLSVNMEEFEAEMQAQRQRGKQSWKASDSVFEEHMTFISKEAGETDFRGYDCYETESVVKIMSDNIEICDILKEGQEGALVLDMTPFYGESGGQAADLGSIHQGGSEFEVFDVKRYNKTFVHFGKVIRGEIKSGDKCTAVIDAVRRNLVKANHTVTHLLQAALREVLGDHVKQAGSLVEPDRMRFDFSHFKAMTPDEIHKVENLVNRKIWENLTVSTENMKLDDALKSGAMAEFGEKYEDTVRVVKAGDFSTELCGGTHAESTGLIGIFKIMKESSPGAGVRRIEGITLRGVLERFNELNDISDKLSNALNVPEVHLEAKAVEILKQNSDLKKEISKLKSENLASNADELLDGAENFNGYNIYVKNLGDVQVPEMRKFSDMIREKDSAAVVLLGSDANGKAMLLCAGTKKTVSETNLDCGAVIKEISAVVGGGGGGRKDMAQAGGKDPSKLEEALEKGKILVKEMLV